MYIVKKKVLFLFIIIIYTIAIPGQIQAHTVLINAIPGAESKWQESPKEVVLTFNERLKKGIYAIQIYDQFRKKVTEQEAELSKDHKQLRLVLPKLEEGAYLTTYYVVSDDGHPVRGSYVFLVGSGEYPSGITQGNKGSHIENGSIYFVRGIYYLSFLSLIGWVFWGSYSAVNTEPIQRRYKFTLMLLQQFHLMGLLMMLAIQSIDYSKLLGIPMETIFGKAWLGSLALSLIGFAVLFRSKWMDTSWLILMLLAKSFSGHAAAYTPWIAIPSSFLHLFTASVWAGGLLFILVFWSKHRLQLKVFIPIFSKIAFGSFMLLFFTGMVLTIVYVDNLYDLLFTAWGVLLLMKIILVLAVICVAYTIRVILKNKPVKGGGIWFKSDFVLMILIVGIVGILSYLNPIPVNTPLTWKEKVEHIEMEMSITPNAPGNNQFEISFSNADHIRRAELWLTYLGEKEIAPIQVPLRRTDKAATLIAEGYYLPFPGKWMAEVRVIDKNDMGTFLKKRFRIFKVRESK